MTSPSPLRRDRVIDTLAASSRALHSQEIAARLGVDAAAYPALQRLLDDLSFDGSVVPLAGQKFRLNRKQAEAGKQLYVNPRNTAAGSLRQLDPSVTASRPLHFFAYAWGEMSEMPAETQSGMLKWLKKAGFQTNALWTTCTSVEELLAFHHDIGLQRAGLDYDIDGVEIGRAHV